MVALFARSPLFGLHRPLGTLHWQSALLHLDGLGFFQQIHTTAVHCQTLHCHCGRVPTKENMFMKLPVRRGFTHMPILRLTNLKPHLPTV